MSLSAEELASKISITMANVLNLEPEVFDETASQETIEAWDSLQHLNVVLALEGAFGVRFSPEDISSMNTYSQIVDVVKLRLNGS